MTDYRERLLDNALAEELGGEQPPDLVRKIVAAAEDRNAGHVVEVSARPVTGEVRSRSWFASGHAWQTLAVALAPCVLAGLLVASFLWGEDGEEDNGNTFASLQVRNGFLVANVADAGEFRGTPVLQAGWAFANEESSELMIGPNLLKFQQARAVVRLGGVPDSYQAIAIARSLEQNNLVRSEEEYQMMLNPKRWITGLGVAICLFTGSAEINGQTVDAAKSENVTLAKVFARYDLNGDGILQADECICEGSRMCDADKNGQVTREEFDAGVAKLMGSEEKFVGFVKQCGGLEMFYTAAKNGTVEKVAAVSMDAVFAHLDKDSSGVLEKEECICQGSKAADANGDGQVTREEVTAVAVQHFGSEEKFLDAVRAAGGVEAFFKAAEAAEKAAQGSSMEDVFAVYDLNASGKLEQNECICHGSKMADTNGDGIVTREEMKKVAVEMFGSVENFESYIASCGGAAAFYEAVKAGKLPPHNGK